MKYVKLSFVVAALALFALACGETTTNTTQTANSNQPTVANHNAANANATKPDATPVDELAAAKTTYSQVCSNCHGAGADGGIVNLEGKKLKVPSLKEGHALNHTDEQLAKKIANGGDGMPAFKDRLKPEQINDLVRFVRREFQGGASNAKPAAPAPKS